MGSHCQENCNDDHSSLKILLFCFPRFASSVGLMMNAKNSLTVYLWVALLSSMFCSLNLVFISWLLWNYFKHSGMFELSALPTRGDSFYVLSLRGTCVEKEKHNIYIYIYICKGQGFSCSSVLARIKVLIINWGLKTNESHELRTSDLCRCWSALNGGLTIEVNGRSKQVPTPEWTQKFNVGNMLNQRLWGMDGLQMFTIVKSSYLYQGQLVLWGKLTVILNLCR